MSDIRKRTGTKGTTYQVRYPSSATKTGYAYKSFNTMKEARAFRDEIGGIKHVGPLDPTIQTMEEAVDAWLKICEREGRDGRDPVTGYTLKGYMRRAEVIKAYPWEKRIGELQTPDIVAFRSWLLREHSRDLARRALTSLHGILKEMAMRGHIASNVAAGVSIRAESRYDEEVRIPSPREVQALLRAADDLAASSNKQVARTWQRYRPILYLAADTGMRPQEYLVIARSNLRDGGVYVDRALERGGYKISVTKTRAGRRFIDLSPGTFQMIKDYADNHAIQNKFDLVFPTANGRWQDTDNWRKRGFYKACLHAGLIEERNSPDGNVASSPKYSPYDLRHFYASMLIEQRVNLKRIQMLMGHEDIKTTLNVYGHLINRVEGQDDDHIGMLDLIAAE